MINRKNAARVNAPIVLVVSFLFGSRFGWQAGVALGAILSYLFEIWVATS